MTSLQQKAARVEPDFIASPLGGYVALYGLAFDGDLAPPEGLNAEIEAPEYEPTPEEEAYATGYFLAADGEDPQPPADMPFALTVEFFRGATDARQQAIDEEADRWEAAAEYEDFVALMNGADDRHDAEVAEVWGHRASHPIR